VVIHDWKCERNRFTAAVAHEIGSVYKWAERENEGKVEIHCCRPLPFSDDVIMACVRW
jgi:hypothetical protein